MHLAPCIETTISTSMPSVDWIFVLGTKMFLLCLTGLIGCLLSFLALLLHRIFIFLGFELFGFVLPLFSYYY